MNPAAALGTPRRRRLVPRQSQSALTYASAVRGNVVAGPVGGVGVARIGWRPVPFGMRFPTRDLARTGIAACAVVLLAQPSGSAQTVGVDAPQASCASATPIRWHPATPTAGSLFRIVAESLIDTARLAGEPLHFRVEADSVVALAAVPVDSTSGINVSLRCGVSDTVSVRIPTRSADYPLERLRVAPRFSAPPTAALAARMKREAALAAEVSRTAHQTPRLWTTPFLAPRVARITSGFGGGRTFNGNVTSRHMGTDYAGAVGAPIRATNRGVVRLVGEFYLGGNVVYLDHGEGLVTAYLHMSQQLVQVGDTVAQGGIIGRVGATGRVTGPHLHFIARYGSITVDPLSLLNLLAQ